jgi:hypothetical protein
MMMLTSIGTVPASLTLASPFGVAELMIAMLAVSALGIVAAALRGSLRSRRGRVDRGFISPVARQAAAA